MARLKLGVDNRGRIMSTPGSAENTQREKAWERLLARLRTQEPINAGRWHREELYERTEEEKRAMKDFFVRESGDSE